MPTDLFVLVCLTEAFDGTPQLVSSDTAGNADGAVPRWVTSPREAKKFQSRQAAHQFLRRLNCFDTYVWNIGRMGFAT